MVKDVAYYMKLPYLLEVRPAEGAASTPAIPNS